VGEPAAGQVAQGHNARVPGRFCAKYYGKATVHMRAVESRSEGQDAADRLSPAGGQSECVTISF
jgi:hypothetical protein